MNELAISLSNAMLITRREVRDSFRDWRILGPILVMTFVFPYLATVLSNQMINFIEGFGFGGNIADRAVPFLLMVVGFFPVSLSLVIALETFVGEKERRSLEPLLSTPLTNWELYVGKTLAAMLPPLLASLGGMVIYLLLVVGGESEWRPQAVLIIQIMLLSLIQTLVMVAGAVVVSSQTTSVRAANLLSSFIVVPIAIALQVEAAIVFVAPDFSSPSGVGILWMAMLFMSVIALLLLRMGAAIFNREELLGRAIDSINPRRVLMGLWRQMRAVDAEGTPAHSLTDLYRRGLPFTLRRLRPMLWVGVVAIVGGLAFGYVIGSQPQYSLNFAPDFLTPEGIREVVGLEALARRAHAGDLSLELLSLHARFILFGLLGSLVSFGVVPFVLTPALYVAFGFGVGSLAASANPTGEVWRAALPQLLIAAPALILVTTANFRIGAVLTRLPPGLTIGEAWGQAIGDALKIGVFVGLPALGVTYLIERLWLPPIMAQLFGF